MSFVWTYTIENRAWIYNIYFIENPYEINTQIIKVVVRVSLTKKKKQQHNGAHESFWTI